MGGHDCLLHTNIKLYFTHLCWAKKTNNHIYLSYNKQYVNKTKTQMICMFSHSSCTNLNYLFFFFLLHTAFKVATSCSAILLNLPPFLFSLLQWEQGGLEAQALLQAPTSSPGLSRTSSPLEGERGQPLYPPCQGWYLAQKIPVLETEESPVSPVNCLPLLLARAKVLAMSLLSPAAILVCAGRAYF